MERIIEENTNVSIHHRAQKLELCSPTLWKIFQKILVFELQQDPTRARIAAYYHHVNRSVNEPKMKMGE